MDVKEAFDRFEGSFIKKTAPAVLTSAQKALLNRKGNALFNTGDIEAARRIFLATGYSDGLCRVGDSYLNAGRAIDALRMYWLAPDKKKAEGLIQKLSRVVQKVLEEEEGDDTKRRLDEHR